MKEEYPKLVGYVYFTDTRDFYNCQVMQPTIPWIRNIELQSEISVNIHYSNGAIKNIIGRYMAKTIKL